MTKRDPTKRPSRETIGERMRKHGHAINRMLSPTYRSWSAMLNRCRNERGHAYSQYGGRGIKVCARWVKFENFLADMGERPAGTTLDRFPNRDGNYEPANCRWATWREQRLNQNRTRAVERSDGRCFPSIIEAAEATGGNKRGIWDTCTGRQKSHRGFGWRFV